MEKTVFSPRSRNRLLSRFTICLLLLSTIGTFSLTIYRTQPTQILVLDDYPAIQEAANKAIDGDAISARHSTYFVHDARLNALLSANSALAWNKTYGGTEEDFALAFVQTVDGGYALAGHTYSFGAGSDDFWLVKTKGKESTIIVPDGYSTIQEAINAANPGDTIFVRSGLYYEHIIVNKTVQLVGEDPATTVIDGNLTGTIMRVTSDNVNVTGFTVQRSGNVQMPALDAGICLNGTTGCTVSENRAVDNGFAAISLLYSQQNTITYNNLSGAGWGGIHLLSSSRNIVSGNIIDNKYGGVNGHVSSNYNNITGNIISNCTHGMFYHAASYNNIRRNNISTVAVEGIWLQDQVSYNVMAENNLTNCRVAIRVQGPNYNNTLSKNFITGAEYGIKIENNARYTHIVDNVIVNNRAGTDSWRAGIRLDSGPDSQIHSNTITGNNYGILLYSYSPRVSIYNNTIASNEFGIRVASGGSSYLNVSDNIVMNNLGYGVGVTGFTSGSHRASITRNIIVNNSDGIALGQYSNYNTISQNNISKNGYGFYIEYSTQNTIWENNIIDNDQQVYVSAGSVNNWDSGYSVGGNYWSNYTGADMYRGQDQNLPGSDGVGDTPYIIDSNNRDSYPLMEPWFWTPNDVAAETGTLFKDVIGQGYTMRVNVTVANQGIYTEEFNVTLYSNATAVETREIVLFSGDSTTLTFTWNTSDFTYGNYTIWIYAESVPGEAYIADNIYVVGVVTVTIPGDVDGDFFVNITDATLIGSNWMQLASGANPNADINGDGSINIKDAAIIGLNWLQQAQEKTTNSP